MKNWDTLEADVVKLLNKHYTPGRGGRTIDKVGIHHNAGVLSIDQIWQVWQDRQASAHYQVETGGRIGQLVWDGNTAWHAANQAINQTSIGIEFANSAGAAQDWPITDATIENGAHLVAAICKYYKLGRPRAGTNVRFHREFTTTSCPYHLAPGGKYNAKLMERAEYWYDVMAGGTPAPAPTLSTPNEKVLDYSRDQIDQDTYWNCGPASTQTVVKAAGGGFHSEATLGRELGTSTNGTDYIGQFPKVLNKYLPGANYRHTDMPNDPPTAAQKNKLWDDIVSSINAGYGVIANIVAPPSNYPRAVAPSVQNLAYSGGTVFHYLAVMGFSTNGGKRVWLADSGFRPYGAWIAFDQLATLIPPKGYAYSTAQPQPKEWSDVASKEEIQAVFYEAMAVYLGPLISDVKDLRYQLTGSRDSIPGDVRKSYPGFPQLGQNGQGANLTVTDAVAAIRRDLAEIRAEVTK